MASHISGFDESTVSVGGVELHVASGGEGAPVLLLHGFPETHLTWRHVGPTLAEGFRVVCPDLPGYGASAKPVGADAYAKRATAATMVRLMRELGHERFSVVGHDRGALVAFRAALDHPDAIEHLAVIDVIPTVDMWASLHGVGGVFAFHLYFLAQQTDIAERMIAADPDAFYRHFFQTWVTDPATIPDEIQDAYLATARTPEGIRAICDDYRASAFIDGAHDTADREAGNRIQAPTLAIWQDPGDSVLPFDPAAVWASWATDLRTLTLSGGHFLPEAQPDAVAGAIRELIK